MDIIIGFGTKCVVRVDWNIWCCNVIVYELLKLPLRREIVLFGVKVIVGNHDPDDSTRIRHPIDVLLYLDISTEYHQPVQALSAFVSNSQNHHQLLAV